VNAKGTIEAATGSDTQLDLSESAQEAQGQVDPEELYKGQPGAFFNGRIWTIPEDVPF
jgi:hypothetical protein